MIFAYECFADKDVFITLRNECNLPLRAYHRSGQGQVINALFVEKKANIGMVDEDPSGAHHRLRDRASLVKKTSFLEVRKFEGRHLIILKPELEECFQKSMGITGLSSTLPRPKELRPLLGTPDHHYHLEFQKELTTLYEISRDQNISTFITDLVEVIQDILKES